ncbi:MAG: hypothetical protein M0C28_19125, partial [Candidatus Moduliflexus flocculans]|nr:hypothetical protein [Candidatus Moduliflexus flocculans]
MSSTTAARSSTPIPQLSMPRSSAGTSTATASRSIPATTSRPCPTASGSASSARSPRPSRLEKPANIKGVTFEDAFVYLKRTVAEIRDRVDCVVILYHGGIEKDIATGLPIGPKASENEGYKIAKHAGADVILTGTSAPDRRRRRGSTAAAVVRGPRPGFPPSASTRRWSAEKRQVLSIPFVVVCFNQWHMQLNEV